MNQAQGQPAQGQQVRFLRPEQIRNIGYLSPEEKQKYEEGLRQLYTKMEQNPPDSNEHLTAKHRIIEFSRMVINKIKSIQARNQAAAQPQLAQAGQPGQSNNMNAQQQNAQNEQAQNLAQVQAQAQVQAHAQTQAQAQGQTMANRPQVQMPNNHGVSSSTPNNATPVVSQVPKLILNHTNSMPWNSLRPTTQTQLTTPEQISKWQNEMKQRYMRFLVQMENIKTRSQKLEAVVKERQEKGQLSADDYKKFQEQKQQEQTKYTEAQRFVESVRQQMKMNGQQNAQQARSQSMQQPNASTPTASHPMQAATASVNAAMDAAKNQQLAASRPPVAAGQSQQQQPSQQPQVQPQVPPQTQQQQHPGTPATPATPAMSMQQGQQQQQPQQPHAAPTPSQPQIKTEPTNNMSRPPPVNTAIATAASSANMPSAGTPTQASARVQTPQSAGQQATPVPQPVRPLTHAAAVSRANSSTNIPGQPSNTPGIVSTPSAPGLVGGSNHTGHSHAHPQPSPALNPKMPISKNLPPKATETPQAVSVGGGNTPGRPSLSGGGGLGGGVMGQPVINKMPPVQFDAEGEHVLSKKKLDELVRQVCGGGSPGADGNYLTPDVEESVLNVADNFVDQVIHAACRLAKERGSKVLETRDLQVVLERVYNIRIPGYTSEELRTVRKVQPSANWISKVHAVQAAKVMPGKDDK